MGASRRAGLLAVVTGSMWSACAPAGDELAVSGRIALPFDSAETLHVDESGRFWVGRPGEMVVLDTAGARIFQIQTPGDGSPEMIGRVGDVAHLRQGDTLSAVSYATGSRLAARAGFGGVPVLPDVRGRFLYQGAGSGAVLGFHPETLDPIWGWAARGAATTALAAAAEGDVLWQALTADDDGGSIMERDVQTGRVLGTRPVPNLIAAIVTAEDGDLLVATVERARVEVLRLRPRSGEVVRVWRSIARLPGGGPVRLEHPPGSPVVAVYRAGSEAGLRVLDAEAGTPVGSVGETPLDAVIAPDAALYLLYPGEIRRVSLRRRSSARRPRRRSSSPSPAATRQPGTGGS